VFGASIAYRFHEEFACAFASQELASFVTGKREFVRMVLYIVTVTELTKALGSLHRMRIG
jgi:hypothetical protein